MRKSATILLLSLIVFNLGGCSRTDSREVVVYTSQDQVFSEPILNDFEKATGIKVRVVYDVEASKTTGLVNRLMAEKDRPKCDVFWNSEFARTIALKQQGVLTPYRSPSAEDIPATFRDKEDYWTGFSARARVLILQPVASSGAGPSPIHFRAHRSPMEGEGGPCLPPLRHYGNADSRALRGARQGPNRSLPHGAESQ